ncbi:tyrosine-type recombinase/integrase [Clostridiales Family XIII bacterium ASD5510]|uniref:Tyrosine-type recombinase/integrase n=1 Tax=Hominibacterium faecale TaxID=2839743 RepID=A0A9J6QZ79_9FIRM|nr:tyrosine-type recombinase/integrase [Hominibacterium faecale]MCU7380817.1 tyrosine-type recombinase/integrase [Hominibacterium faecale]
MPGTMRKRGGDSWYLEVTIGTDFRGKPIRYNKTVHGTKKEAEKELARFYIDCEDGDISKSGNITINSYWELFLKNYCKPKKLKERTIARYKTFMKCQIGPVFGNMKLTKLKRLQVQEWINYLLDEKGLSSKTIRGAYSLLHTMYDAAIKWELVNNSPCSYIDLPPLKKQEADYLRLDEVRTLLSALDDIAAEELQYTTATILTLLTGIRLGELTGLRWSDIDFDAAEMKLERQRAYIHGVGIIEYDLKTDNSNRTLAIPDICISYLHRLRAAHSKQKLLIGSKWVDSGYVLVNAFGEPIYPRNPSRWFIDFVEKLDGVHRITFHQLRHTHVALLAHLGVDIHKISKKVGHSEETTTLRTYMHILEKTEHEDAEKLNTFYSQNKIQ